MANRPGFFKFYMPSLGIKNQKIPSRFIQSLKRPWWTNLGLRDRYNNLWAVKLEKVGNGWYFKDGWTQFVDENMIKEGDLLVYEHVSQGLLDFKVYDGSTCLTKGVEGQKTKSTGGQKRTTESDDTDDIDYDPTHEEENWSDNYHKGEEVMDDDTDDIDYNPRTEEGNRQDQRDEYPTGKELVIGCQYVQTTREMHQERTQRRGPRYNNPKLKQPRDAAASASKHRRKKDDLYGADIFRTGLIPQPKNPYFVTKLGRRASDLYIPMELIKDHNLELPECIQLIDPKGRSFHATRKEWSDGRTFYVGGWKALCGINLVEVEDSCICEFVQNGGDFCISVSFFPPKES